jgi:hypothetical protein
MSEKVWFASAARRLGVYIAEDEPSHIHIPRRRRVVRPDDQGTGEARGSRVSDEERGAA